MKRSRGQSILEYSIVLGLVAVAFYFMQIYMQGAIKQTIRISADRLGNVSNGTVYYEPSTHVVMGDLGTGNVNRSSWKDLQIATGAKRQYANEELGHAHYESSTPTEGSIVQYYDIQRYDLIHNTGEWILRNYSVAE